MIPKDVKSLLTIALLIFTVADSFAQKCPQLPRGSVSASEPFGYKPRKDGAYCEGLITSGKSSGIIIELASLTNGPINFLAVDDEEIVLGSSIPGPSELYFCGVSYQFADSYRLDAVTQPGKEIAIPAVNVISQRGIDKSHLGFFGKYSVSGAEHYFPINVSSKRVIRRTSNSFYRLIFISNIMMRSAQCAYFKTNGKQVTSGRKNLPPAAVTINGNLVTIDVPKSIGSGVFKFQLDALSFSNVPKQEPFTITFP